MVAFIPDGYLDRGGALQVVIETRFPDERKALDDIRKTASERGRLPNLTIPERQLAEKAEPVLRSLLYKGSLPAVIFDQHGEDQVPAHFWASEDADDVLLHGSHRIFFHETDLRSALSPTEASIVPPPTQTRGRRAVKLPAVKAAMAACDLTDLASMTEEVMAVTFNASRDTCRRARAAVLSENPHSNSRQ
ncbi:hypothetical protein [Sphingopyxis sp.]|uniref:hypothetical protein n=1 Tax=Sphingopyxis sp. TaxID=1908224 RepID=UPI0035B09E34